jgi:hypothetical protein
VQHDLDDADASVGEALLEVDDRAVIAIALIENIQREELSPLEESTALKRLIDEFDLTPMKPGCGTCFSMRQRKSCESSSAVGFLNATSETPCGSTEPITWRTMPPLPAVSIACSTSSTAGVSSTTRDCANRRSCSSSSSSAPAARSSAPRFLPFV